MQENFGLFLSEGGKVAGEIFRLGISLGQMEQGKGGGGRGGARHSRVKRVQKVKSIWGKQS